MVNGNQLEIAMTLTDPKNWEGEWKGVRRWNRVNDIDVQEVECRPDLNEHLQSTSSKVHVGSEAAPQDRSGAARWAVFDCPPSGRAVQVHASGGAEAARREGDAMKKALLSALMAVALGRPGARASFAGRVRSDQEGDPGRHGQGIPLAEPAHLDRSRGPGREGQEQAGRVGRRADEPDLPDSRRLEVEHHQAGRQGDGGGEPGADRRAGGHLRLAHAGRRPRRCSSGPPVSARRSRSRTPQHAHDEPDARSVWPRPSRRSAWPWPAVRPRRSSRAPAAAPAARAEADADRRAAERAGARQPRQAASEAPPFDVTSNWFIDVSAEPRGVALRPAVSRSSRRRRRSTSTLSEKYSARGQGLSRRHRPVLAGRPAAHHDALLADGDDADSHGHLHDQRLHEQRPHRLSRRPQAHRSRHHRPHLQRRVDRHLGGQRAGGGHHRLPRRPPLDGSGRRARFLPARSCTSSSASAWSTTGSSSRSRTR